MALVTRDPAQWRLGGWMFLLAVPAALWLAFDLRQDSPGAAALVLLIAVMLAAAGLYAMRRASQGAMRR